MSTDRYDWRHCSNHVFWASGCSDCFLINILTEEKNLIKYGHANNFIIEINNPNPKFQLIRQQLARVLAVFFAKNKIKAANAAVKIARSFTKTDIPSDKKKEIALAAYLAISWDDLIDNIEVDLKAAAQAGAIEGLMQLNAKENGLFSSADNISSVYAKNRAVEIIGKKYDDSKIVDNPDAKFVIAKTTKDDLEDIVEKATKDEVSIEELENRILAAGTFSDLRSQLISKTETAMAQVKGHTSVWAEYPQTLSKVAIKLSDDHDVYDICDELSENGPYEISNMPLIPAHPNCACSVIGIVK